MEKIEKTNLRKSNFQKPSLHWICSTFLDLMDSLHKPKGNPDERTYAATQETPLTT